MKNFVQSIVALVALGPTLDCAAGTSSLRSMEEAVHAQLAGSNLGEGIVLLSKEELADERIARKKRMRERRERARDLLGKLPLPQQAEKVPADDVERHLSWFGGGSSASATAYSAQVLADPSEEYDKWAQSYRMLGGYIDCDHPKDDEHHSGSGDNNNDDEGSACSRWMIWASYVNPDYQGYEYEEYYGDNPPSKMDCHSSDTQWKLLGVYRQEFYQYIEQISKHLWAIDDYEYVVALAGLAYMTDADCYQVGADGNGDPIYAGVAPQPYGTFKMAVYSDEYCLEPDDSMGVTFDSYGLQNDIDLGSKDATDDDGKAWAYEWWFDTQEENLEQLNKVYDSFRYCTSCVDYPTYQDGYFIGDSGTDDDDLINQCWKFWSHDSYTCEADCLATADAQGTILTVDYGGKTFGAATSDYWSKGKTQATATTVAESSLTRLLANAFLTLSFLLFVATFLAFAVARRSRYRESRSSRSRRLLDDDRSRRSRRKSRTRGGGDEGDGIFKEKSQSQSRSRSKRSSSRSSRRSSSRRSKSYEAPTRKAPAADDEY